MASFTPLPTVADSRPTEQPIVLELETANAAKLQVGLDHWIRWPSVDLAGQAADAIFESGLVTRPESADQPDAMSGELVVRTFQGMLNPGLAMFTGFIIPGVVDYDVEVVLRMSGPGDEAHACERAYTQRVWNQVFLIFAYPFRSPAYRRSQAVDRMAVECLYELLDEQAAGDTVALERQRFDAI